MDEAPPEVMEAVAARPRRRWWKWLSWPLKIVVGLLAALLLAAAAFLAFLDTAPGHRFIADRIADLAPRSGLRIVIGRIEGSIWGETSLRNVRLYDPAGQFAEVPLMEVDWQPLGWLANRLILDSAEADLVYLDRLPRLGRAPSRVRSCRGSTSISAACGSGRCGSARP